VIQPNPTQHNPTESNPYGANPHTFTIQSHLTDVSSLLTEMAMSAEKIEKNAKRGAT